jgi:hypothetical protein
MEAEKEYSRILVITMYSRLCKYDFGALLANCNWRYLQRILPYSDIPKYVNVLIFCGTFEYNGSAAENAG